MIQFDVTRTLGNFRLAPKLQVGPGITVLFGQSGAGKTLTLEAIAGLLTPDRGRIAIHDRAVFDAATGLNVPPYDRRLGYVVQSYALFPHLTVAENVAYGVFDLPRAERDQRVDGLLRTLGIQDLAGRRPARISGGQAQRTALARALVRRPQALLLDEPFAALDEGVALTLRRELRRLVRDLDLPVLMVTHDLTEASHIGDCIAVMDAGQVLQVGDRPDVLQRPRTARVARLLGIANVLEGKTFRSENGVVVNTPIGQLQTAQSDITEGPVRIAIRADQIILTRPDRQSDDRPNTLDVVITDEADFGHSRALYARLAAATGSSAPTLEIQIAPHPYQVMGVATRRRWRVHIPPAAVHVMRT
ncbi:MAG: ABC transporter ATP-binding protein [Chloroflexota bacterium]|nr:ABC transporter ATP-binding protein [Chloroflexota bacterium]